MIIQQSVFDKWGVEDESVQAICTSPPYYALRKYAIPDVVIGGDEDCQHAFQMEKTFDKNHIQGGDCQRPHNFEMQVNSKAETGFCIKCSAWQGQYGLEPTPQMYVEHTLLWAKEAFRVLRNDGIFFLNLADSYNSGGNYRSQRDGQREGIISHKYLNNTGFVKTDKRLQGCPPKCQLLIPHRVAIALVESGWCLRNTIVWHKPNAMPESVTDRFSKKYEYIFMFTKQPKYYFDLDAIREPAKYLEVWSRKGSGENTPYNKNNPRIRYGLTKHELATQRNGSYSDPLHNKACNPLGKNPGDVWKHEEVRTAEDNFFDMLGYFADETGRKPTEKDILWIANCTGYEIPLTNDSDIWSIPTSPSPEKHYAMWPERLVERMIKCSTKAGDIVLDPFCGSATTLKVAKELGRIGIGIDLGYHEMSTRRISKIQKEMFV